MIRATVVDGSTGEVLRQSCRPDELGDCPNIEASGLVPCAGHVLEARDDAVGFELRIQVGARATACPLRCFVVPCAHWSE